MTNYTYQNHLKYTIGGRLYGYRENSIEPFNVVVGAVDKDVYRLSNYRQELRRTADLVYKEFGKDLILFLSGGTDSEIVLRSFIEIGFKPRCATIKFADDLNLSEVEEAKAIANEVGVSLEELPFDVREFYNSGESSEFGKDIQCTQITYQMVYLNILKLGMPAVMGGEVLCTRGVYNGYSEWYYTFRENEDASAIRFSEKFNIPLVNEWFSYTPELLLFYLERQEIQDLISNKMNYKLSSVSSKNEILRKLYPEIRPKSKRHGFEKLLAFNYEAYRENARYQIKRLEPSLDGIPFQETLKMLRGEYGN